MSIKDIEIPIPRSNDKAPRWNIFTINTDKPIVKIWFIIVEKVNATDFNCARKSWNNNALIATGIIRNNIQKKYFG